MFPQSPPVRFKINFRCESILALHPLSCLSAMSCHSWSHSLGQRCCKSPLYCIPLSSNWPPTVLEAVFIPSLASSCVHFHVRQPNPVELGLDTSGDSHCDLRCQSRQTVAWLGQQLSEPYVNLLTVAATAIKEQQMSVTLVICFPLSFWSYLFDHIPQIEPYTHLFHISVPVSEY